MICILQIRCFYFTDLESVKYTLKMVGGNRYYTLFFISYSKKRVFKFAKGYHYVSSQYTFIVPDLKELFIKYESVSLIQISSQYIGSIPYILDCKTWIITFSRLFENIKMIVGLKNIKGTNMYAHMSNHISSQVPFLLLSTRIENVLTKIWTISKP